MHLNNELKRDFIVCNEFHVQRLWNGKVLPIFARFVCKTVEHFKKHSRQITNLAGIDNKWRPPYLSMKIF